MKIQPDPSLVDRARGGDLHALNALLLHIQGPVYNLAVRMLGRREDAQDATQEILLKVTTHLGTWRGESAFGTWVFGVAGKHLLNSKQRAPGRRELSFEVLGEGLDAGEAYAQRIGWQEQALSPEDKLAARETALSCTQAMLMCLDAPGRLAYVLDVVFGLESPQAALVQGISAAAHRQRLSRAREAVHGFMDKRCGLVSETAACHCARQLPAKRAAAAAGQLAPGLQVARAELDAAEQGLQQLVRMSDAAAVMRGAPQYAAPEALLRGIRLVVEQSPMLRQ